MATTDGSGLRLEKRCAPLDFGRRSTAARLFYANHHGTKSNRADAQSGSRDAWLRREGQTVSIGNFFVRAAKAPLSVFRRRDGRRGESKHWSHERSPEILHSRLMPAATYSPWLADAAFTAVYQRIKKFTLVDIYRCYELWELAKQSVRVDGAIVEVGVWRGGTGCLLALAAPQKAVYLADTFAGVVNASAHDTRYAGGEHADTSEDVVQGLLTSAGVKNARLLKGRFPDETAAMVEGRVALLHVDVDVYESARATVEWAMPRLLPGTAIIFDDYGFFGCEGVTRLVNDLRGQLSGFSFFYNLNGHAVMVKTAGAQPQT